MDAAHQPQPETPTRLGKKEKLLLKQAQIDAQLKDLATREREAFRELQDHKKFSVGGHFLPLIETLPVSSVTANDLLPDDVLAKAMLAHMTLKMKTRHHRKVLGLPSLPANGNDPASDT